MLASVISLCVEGETGAWRVRTATWGDPDPDLRRFSSARHTGIILKATRFAFLFFPADKTEKGARQPGGTYHSAALANTSRLGVWIWICASSPQNDYNTTTTTNNNNNNNNNTYNDNSNITTIILMVIIMMLILLIIMLILQLLQLAVFGSSLFDLEPPCEKLRLRLADSRRPRRQASSVDRGRQTK